MEIREAYTELTEIMESSSCAYSSFMSDWRLASGPTTVDEAEADIVYSPAADDDAHLTDEFIGESTT